MEDRPKINPALSSLDTALEKISGAGLIILWVIAVIFFIKLPENIPVHFNYAGTPDNYGSKFTLFILPVVATCVFALLTILGKRPWILNYTAAITEENAAQQYTYSTRLLRVMKTIVVFVICLIIVLMYLNVIGKMKGLGVWFVPFIVIVFISPTVYYLIKSMRKHN
jgi:uncharacterized membrane protein